MKADSFGSTNETALSTGRQRKRKIGIPAFICDMKVASCPDDKLVLLTMKKELLMWKQFKNNVLLT